MVIYPRRQASTQVHAYIRVRRMTSAIALLDYECWICIGCPGRERERERESYRQSKRSLQDGGFSVLVQQQSMEWDRKSRKGKGSRYGCLKNIAPDVVGEPVRKALFPADDTGPSGAVFAIICRPAVAPCLVNRKHHCFFLTYEKGHPFSDQFFEVMRMPDQTQDREAPSAQPCGDLDVYDIRV